MASTPPPDDEPTACEQVFAIPELLEQILLLSHVPHYEEDLLHSMRVCRVFHDTITTSPSIRRILGVEQYDDSLEYSHCSCEREPEHVDEAIYANTLIHDLCHYGICCDRTLIQERTGIGAPRCEFKHTLDGPSGQLLGNLSIDAFNSCWHCEVLGADQPVFKVFKEDRPWLQHSCQNMHLSKVAKTTNVTVWSNFHQGSHTYGQGNYVKFKAEGATFGQLLDIAYALDQAAYWHNRARIFHGDHSAYGEYPGIGRKYDLNWLRDVPLLNNSLWRKYDPLSHKYDTKMSWSWQHFVSDASLVKLVVGTPIVKDVTWSLFHNPNPTEMRDANRQNESSTDDDEEVEGLAPGLDWW